MHTLSKRSPSMGRRSLSLLLSIIMTLSLAVVVLISRPDEAHARPDDARAVATVPAPSPPASDYEIGAYFWPLYKQGTHVGWDIITPYESERKPQGVGWYDEDSPEAWSWFNRWALNYGLKFWVIGWFRGGNGPINNDTDGRHAIDAFKASQFSDQMKYAVDIHNAADADAAEVENNIYPYLKTHFEDSRYLVKDNKPILYLINHDGQQTTSFAMDKIRELAILDGWSGVTILERFGQAGSDGQVVYNDMIDAGGTGYGNQFAMPVVSQGWSPEPWGSCCSQGFRTVPQFQTKLQNAKAWMDAQPAGSLGKTMALVGAWNEFGEGHFVAPTSLAGFGYLNAVRQTFTSGGSLPSDTLPASPIQTRFDNLGAHWKLDESSGTVVNDSSIFDHDATNVGATWDPGGGVLGGALDFDGVNDYVQLAPAGTDTESFMHERIGTRTVSLRFKADTTAGTQVLYDEGGTDNGLAIQINNDSIQAVTASSTGPRVLSIPGFTDTTSWHKIDVTFAFFQWVGGVLKVGWMELFVDGVSFGGSEGSLVGPHLSEAALGARWGGDAFGNAGDGGYFNGKIDDVQVSFRPIPPTGPAPIVSGAGRWALDENAGTTAQDSTPNNNDGTLVGGPTWIAGQAGNAVDLDGADDYVTVPDAAVLDGMSQLTVSTWVNLDTLPTATKNYIVVGKDLAYRLIVYDSGAGHFVAATTNNAWYDTGTVAEFTTPLSLSGWHHLVGVYDGSTVRIYVDGELAGTGPAAISGNIADNNEALQFGGVGIGASSLIHTDGKIDEVRVYRRALNATEVQTLYSCVTCEP